MGKLEDFCSSGEFTTLLGNFANDHAGLFQFEAEEQSLECYQLFLTFKAMVDERLEVFIASQPPMPDGTAITSEIIMASLVRINDIDPGILSCIDYLMAAADYLDFVNLMLDFKDGFEYEVGFGPENEEEVEPIEEQEQEDEQPGEEEEKAEEPAD